MLDALQKQALERVVPALDRAMGRVDDYLFDRSQSGNDDLGLTALRDLRRVRAQIAQRFEQAVIAGFRQLRDPREGTGLLGEHGGLSLLAEDALEEQLANEQLAESLSRMHAPSLELLGKRLAHILGRESLKPTDNPFAPAFLAAALRKAAEAAELDAGVRIVVFKFFERELGTALAHAYDRSNTLLVAAGVLPQLRATSKAEAMPSGSLPGESSEAGGGYGQGSAQQGGPQAGMPGGMQNMQANPADQAMFANMLGMLQGWRNALGPMGGQGGTGPAVTLGSNELVTILSLLQRDLPARMQFAQRAEESPLAVQIRDEVVQGARKLGVTSDNLQLDGLDEDAVDLVALLFDVLLDGPQFDSDVRRKIGRMLVPYVKVAVKDRRMFMFKDHPARRLLNTVAEACEGNRGEAPQERELLGHVDSTINRLVAEFNEDVAIFETLESELRSYMAQHRKRFELAEKRAAEAQRGRERLDQARSSINAELTQHRGERELPAVMDEFLQRYASHHLTQVVLRDGHGSPRHEDAMRAIDDLLVAFDYAELRTPASELPTFPVAQFETILASSGCTDDAASSAIASLQDALVRLSQGERAADITSHMPEQRLAPEPAAQPEPEPVLEIVAGTDTLDFDGKMLERMRKLQVGSWIQLATSAERIEPAKVSWISPISGRLLLVNRRGIRVLVASAEELAAMAKLGKVSVREGETPFEDAMQQVAGRLQSAANQG
ncbi:MAG TPA: DUF1631 family protein [Thermomonas sp.]|nr:DUF1631 family protein [Thermomonas sp.]